MKRSRPIVGAIDPIGDHCIVFVLSQCLSSPAEVSQWVRFLLEFFFTLVPNALEPSKSLPKGLCSATPLFLLTYESLAIRFYLEHVKVCHYEST